MAPCLKRFANPRGSEKELRSNSFGRLHCDYLGAFISNEKLAPDETRNKALRNVIQRLARPADGSGSYDVLSVAMGHPDAGTETRAHALGARPRHQAGDDCSAVSSWRGLTLPPSLARSARSSGPCFSRTQVGDLCSRLLLAPPCGSQLPARPSSEIQAGLLGYETGNKQKAGRAQSCPACGPRMGRSRILGMSNEEPGETAGKY